MPLILKYRKVTDEYTTYTAIDNGEENKKITELCTINGDTYISIPDNVVLPEQAKQIKLESVILIDELKEQIEEASPHTQLIKKRIQEKIAEKYSIEDELKIIRNKINDIDIEKYTEYNAYIEGCIAEGKVKKEELGITEKIVEPIKKEII